MDRIEFVCPVCRAIVPGPPSLAGESATCPRCSADVHKWPSPAIRPSSPTEHETRHGSGPVFTMLCGLLFCFVATLIVFGATWVYFRAVKTHVTEYAAMGLPTNPKEWTNRELEKYLVKKGIDCELVGPGGYRGVLFCFQGFGTDRAESLRESRLITQEMFYVKRHASPREAQREAESEGASTLVIYQWGIFTFEGLPNAIIRIKNVLPN